MGKKKTHEEYVAELAVKNPNIEAIGKYVSTHVKIMHRCKIDGYEWEAMPSNILKGRGCPKCSNHKQKTHEEYIKEVQQINQDIEIVGIYINNSTPILHKCKKHNIEWNAIPANILNGHGCPRCKGEKLADIKSKTKEQYVEELSIINPNIIVIGDYINAKTPILHKCIVDEFEWNASPNNILSGKGCPMCGGTMKKQHDKYVEEVLKINHNIEVLGEYINANTPILHRCLKHNIEWYITPTNILNGNGCIECGYEKISEKNRMSHDEYVERLKIINPYIEVIDVYVNSYTPIMHRCMIDGYEWITRPCNLISGCGCPKCNESFGERKVRQWLENHNIDYIFQKSFEDCRDINPLPFDFYLPKLNKCIEYDGKQHFEPIDFFGGQEYFEYIVKHDNIKNKYCKNNGISLLRIPYFVKDIEEELNNFLFI